MLYNGDQQQQQQYPGQKMKDELYLSVIISTNLIEKSILSKFMIKIFC